MTMQMTVTYQKTKWIRSACSDAVGGSQFGIQRDHRHRPADEQGEQRQLDNRTPPHFPGASLPPTAATPLA